MYKKEGRSLLGAALTFLHEFVVFENSISPQTSSGYQKNLSMRLKQKGSYLKPSHENSSHENAIESIFDVFAKFTNSFRATNLISIFRNNALKVQALFSLGTNALIPDVFICLEEDEPNEEK